MVRQSQVAKRLIEELREVISEDRITDEDYARLLYSTDASVMSGDATLVIFPETTEEVVAIVVAGERHEVPIVARGAGTGLAAGAVPLGGIVVCLTRMNTVAEIDPVDRTAWVGPGVINLDLSTEAAAYGLHFAPDPSSQSVCTIGGNIACNAGGPHCLADGNTASHVLALEVVISGGEVVVLGGSAPDPLGLDLRGVVVGSEGTLGIVTRALVRLTENPPDVRTLLLAFDSVESAATTVSGIIGAGVIPAALEMMDQRMAIAVENWLGAGLPTEAACLLLAEVVGESEAVEAEAELIRRVAGRNEPISVQTAESEAERALLWKGRKSAFGAVAQAAPDYYLQDVVVPRTRLAETMSEIYSIADRYGVVMMNLFHAGDGNLHPLIAYDASDADEANRVHLAAAEMVEVCVAKGGSLSGEHGVGLEKRDLMSMVFNEVDLDAQARIKESFDPVGLLNPSKILPEGARCFDSTLVDGAVG